MLDINSLERAMSDAGVSCEHNLRLDEIQELAFQEVGIDSLDLFNVFLELEVLTGKKVDDEKIDEVQNIKQLLQLY